MSANLKASAQKVQAALDAQGYAYQVIEFDESTRTSAEAAAAVGCSVGQIAKSLVFAGRQSQQPILIIASGANRVDEKHVAAQIGERLARADPEFVRAATGFAIGGIPPLGHAAPLATYIDQDLLQYDEIWAAAGHPNAVFRLLPADLVAMTGGQVIQVTAK